MCSIIPIIMSCIHTHSSTFTVIACETSTTYKHGQAELWGPEAPAVARLQVHLTQTGKFISSEPFIACHMSRSAVYI